MLKVENLRFGYVPTVDIFRNVNFTIHEGEFIAVGGKNGCGKNDDYTALSRPRKGC